MVLRETAQVPDGDASFTDVERWRWYNTNNIWIDLRALRELQAADQAAPWPEPACLIVGERPWLTLIARLAGTLHPDRGPGRVRAGRRMP